MTRSAHLLRIGEWAAGFAADGSLVGFSNGSVELAEPGPPRHLVVEVGGAKHELSEPASVREGRGALVLEHDLSAHGLRVTVAHRLLLLDDGGVALETSVTLAPISTAVLGGHDVSVRLPASLSIGSEPVLFAPQKNGVGYVGIGGPLAGHFAYELAGGTRSYLGGYVQPLGLPLVSESSAASPWRLTWCADPYFTTAFFLAPRSLCDAPGRELNWRYFGAVPISEPEVRRVYVCAHRGNKESSIAVFYATALSDVPPGPSWLHEIGFTHYDYLSRAGRGWFEDIDTLTGLLSVEERHRVCLCLHGWYDKLGKYAMDTERREIAPSWTLERSHDLSGQANLELSREQVVTMLRYARARGFRVTLYYGDGLIAGSHFAEELFPSEAVLRCTGWDEGSAHSVLLNPLHPTVRTWFLDYTRALTAAFGDEVDGFSWDETYFIAAGELGPASCPGYVDRAFMTLTREIAGIVHEHRSDLAFLGSDCVGTTHYIDGSGRASVGYCLVADGGWQDSACNPEAWPFGVFPNYRNVLWSCNWWPVGNFAGTKYGVENFGAPVATSNGYGENRCLSEMPPGALDEIVALFRRRAPRSGSRGWLSADDARIPGALGTHPLDVHIEAAAGG